jgi:hypothetical protein
MESYWAIEFVVIFIYGKMKFKFEKWFFHNNSEVKFTFMRIVFGWGTLQEVWHAGANGTEPISIPEKSLQGQNFLLKHLQCGAEVKA